MKSLTSRIVRPILGRHQDDLLEDMRKRRLLGHERQLAMVDDSVHGPELRDETEAKSLVSFLCSKDF